MLAMMDDGMVKDIRVHGNVYTFRIKTSSGLTGTRESIGPRADRAQLATLRPARPALPAPKISWSNPRLDFKRRLRSGLSLAAA